MKGRIKSIYILLSLFMFSYTVIAQDCPGVTVEAIGQNPQMGPYNYFGIRVTLSARYDQNITVTGFIHRDVDEESNQDHPFTLTVTAGELTVETAGNFFQTDPTSGASVTITLISPCPGEITAMYAGVLVTYEVANNILRFNSKEDMDAVLNQLDEEYENYNDAHDNNYPEYTAEQLDALDEESGFDEFYTFKAFENLFPGWASKRLEVETTEINWLNSEFKETDPDDIDITFDDAENTLLNNANSYKIGSDVYQVTNEGLYINGELQDYTNRTERNEELLAKNESWVTNPLHADGLLRDEPQPSGPFFADNENFSVNKPVCAGCKTNKKDKGFIPFGNDRYKIKVAIHSVILRSTAKGKVVHFKKKNNGKWKRTRAKMAVFVGGQLYINQCETSLPLFSLRNPSPNGWKKRRQMKIKKRSSDFIELITYKTYSGMLVASFDTEVGHSGGITLIF